NQEVSIILKRLSICCCCCFTTSLNSCIAFTAYFKQMHYCLMHIHFLFHLLQYLRLLLNVLASQFSEQTEQ
ncbi:MAG: hypothetical protein ACKPKO_52095, partial [Candidatus Fonsibacter sp.]